MSDWNPEKYLKFQNERTRPAVDLAGRIEITEPKRVLDIGCGPGNSTAVLKRRFSNAEIMGVDNSPNMLEVASKEYPDVKFRLVDASCELNTLGENEYDVVFSNACIQWLPNHSALLANMMKLLRSGGVMAVQLPVNFEEPVHQIIMELAGRDEWRGRLSNVRGLNVLTEGEYFDILSRVSSDFSMWKTIYMHRMPSHEAILEWYRTTGLKPYLSELNEAETGVFEKQFLDELKKFYPVQQNGEVIFRFPRLFFTATK